jgi:hypothetical protein
MPSTIVRIVAGLVSILPVLTAPGRALAEPALPYARLVGSFGGGGGGRTQMAQAGGLYLGLDAGAAVMLGDGEDSATSAPAFGLHAGYRLPSGLAFDVRGDDLGVASPGQSMPFVVGGAGMRYTLPLLVMPFVEAHVGALDYGPRVSAAADGALGIAVPVGEHLEIDVSARDWIAGVDGVVRHVPMFTLGFEVGFDRGR